jgi:hypothetical protein
LLPGNADADPAVKAAVTIIPSARTSFLMAALPHLMSQRLIAVAPPPHDYASTLNARQHRHAEFG